MCGSVRLHHSLKEPPLVCVCVFCIGWTPLTPTHKCAWARACECWHGEYLCGSKHEARIDLWPGISDAIFPGFLQPGFVLLFLLLAGLLRSPAESVHFASSWPLLSLLASLGCFFFFFLPYCTSCSLLCVYMPCILVSSYCFLKALFFMNFSFGHHYLLWASAYICQKLKQEIPLVLTQLSKKHTSEDTLKRKFATCPDSLYSHLTVELQLFTAFHYFTKRW